VIETVFEPLDIESDYFTVGLGLRRTLLRTLDDTLWMSLGFAHKNSNSRLLGEGFSFSPGVSDGESRIAMVSFSQQWSHRSVRDRRVDAAWLLHSRFTLGIDALDATVHDGLPDGRFLTWQGHAQWRKRLDQNGRRQLAVRGRVQLADSPLLPLEKFTLGGVDTVRGYRENTLVRDNGWSLSLELYWTLSPPGSSWGEWQLVPFIDYGDGWNEGPLELNQELGSVGAGLIWNGPGGWYAELYGAARLVDVGNGGDDLQDQGIYFQVRYEAF